MKILFAMVILMIVATYGCAADDSPALEQSVSDVLEIGDITVEDTEELLSDDTDSSVDDTETVVTAGDTEESEDSSVDDTETVATVEEDVEN